MGIPILLDLEASWLTGRLLSIAVSSEVSNALTVASTTHIIAISGFKLLPIDVLYRDSLGLRVSG